MGRIGRVVAWAARTIGGDTTNNPGGGALLRSTHAVPPGFDAAPLAEDFVVSVDIQGTGRTAAVGYVDGENAPAATPGEARVYARTANGAVVVSLFLRADGSATLQNGNGTMVLRPDGEFNFNGARITPAGEVINANGIELGGHKHDQGNDSEGSTEERTDSAVMD